MKSSRLASKGLVTLPKEVRESLGLEYGDKVTFVASKQGYIVKKNVSDSPFDKYLGFLKKEGCRSDDIVNELRNKM